MRFAPIPHVELTDDQKLYYLGLMIPCNAVIRHNYTKIKSKKIGKLTYHQHRIELFRRIDAGTSGLSKKEIAFITAVRKEEFNILAGWSALIGSYARKFDRGRQVRELTYEDWYQNGTMAMIDAIYQYQKEHKIAIWVSYLNCTIYKKMLNLVNDMRPTSPWSPKALDLYKRYNQEVAKLNGFCNFNRVAKNMKLSPEDQNMLSSLLVRVSRDGDIINRNDFDLLDNVPEKKDKEDSLDNELYLKSIEIAKKKMDDLELYTLAGFNAHGGERGWMTKIAELSRNPKTNKPYTKMAITLAWQRLCQKIKVVYDSIVNDNTEAA